MSSSDSHDAQPSGLSRLRKVLFATSAIAALAAATASTADAQANVRNTTGLRRFGPVDPVTHFPRWYEDTTGLRLKQCTDPGRCFFFPPDPAAPINYPDNYPDEAFFWAVNASAAGPALQRLLYVSALEMAYAGGALVAGDEVTFTRVRIRITGLVPLTQYKVTHPYGVEFVDSDELGIVNTTNDVGLGAAGNFTGALTGLVGPFLVPVDFAAGNVPGAFISDGAALETLTGSPFNTNFIRVEGPNVGDAFPDFQHPDPALGPDPLVTNDVIEVVQFNIQGQVADIMDVDLAKSSLVKTTTKTAVDIWARSANGQNIQAAVDGGLFVNMAERGTTGIYYGRVELGLAAPRPTQILLRNLSDIPATGRIINSPVPDGLMVNSANFTIGGDLFVQATSSDEVSSPVLTAYLEGQPVAALAATAVPGVYSGPLNIPVGTPPPTTVQVKSSFGGADEAPVKVLGTGFIGVPVTPIIANAGPDITVSPGQRFSLSGAASTGPITSYQWTHNAAAAVGFVLENPTSVTPIFTVPNITGTALDVLITLRVTDEFGTPATDSMIIHITNPVAARDSVAVTDARYLTRTFNWRVSGTASLRQSQRITIYLGPVTNTTRVIGTAIVDGAGAWNFTGATNSATATGTIPGNGDSTVWARSALIGDSTAANFRRQ